MKTIRVSKELLINLGNFSNIKIIAELTTDEDWGKAWDELNEQISMEEATERARLAPKPQPKSDETIF